MKLRVGTAVFAVGVALFARSAEAQDPSDPFEGEDAPQFFGEDVAGVTRSTERVEDAPGLIAVLSEREIRERGYRTLADLLADVPGFHLEADERRTVVLTRGIPQSILVVYDGIPLVFDTGRDDLPVGEELSLAHVRRVEVLRGPGTALWGANAFTGIVNVVTEDGRDVSGVRASAEAGGSATGDERAWRTGASVLAGRRGDSLEWSLAARALAENGSDRFFLHTPRQYVLVDPVSIPVTFTDGAGEPASNVFGEAVAKLRWRKLSFASRWSDFAMHGSLSGYTHSLMEEGRNERRRVPTLSARAAWAETSGKWSWETGAFFLQSVHDDRHPLFAREPAHRYGGQIDVRSRSLHGGIDARGDYAYENQTLTGGVIAALADSTIATDYVDPVTGTRTSDAVRRRFRNAILQVYAQDRIVFAERWRLTIGASFDDQTDFAPTVNPRAGLVVKLGSGWIAKALYGEAIRTPDAYDLVGISGGAAVGGLATVRGNPDLEPEKIRTGEVAAEYRRGSIATVSLAAFGSAAYELIEDRAANGEVVPVNDDERRFAGLELLANVAPARKFSLHGTYTYVRSAEEWSGLRNETLPTAPRHVATLGGVWSPLDSTSLSITNRYVSRRNLRGEGDASKLGAYVVTDAHLRWLPRGSRVGAWLQVKNALDTAYWHRNESVPGRNAAVEIPGERRTVRVGLEGRF